jgi:hypothetical protein
VYDSIVELKQEYKFKAWEKKTYNGIDGEPSIDAGENMSIQQFIDSHYFMINGERPVFKLVFEEYLAKKKEHLVKSQHLSDEEAELLINTQKDRWEIIAKDAFDLHRIIVSTKSNKDSTSYQELSANTVGTSFQTIADKVKDAADKVIGKGAAFLYVLLDIKEVYANVISRRALETLENNNIYVKYKMLAEAILNRDNTGFCPIETAVCGISEPDAALAEIRKTIKRLKGE